jgi:hypothetical protein
VCATPTSTIWTTPQQQHTTAIGGSRNHDRVCVMLFQLRGIVY